MRSICILALAFCFALPAQVATSGPQVLTFFSAIDDSDQPFAMYVPPSYEATKKWPLVISLHGAGSNHRLNLRRVFGQGNRMGETDAEATRYFPKLREVDFLVASPLARGTMGYWGIAEEDVYAVLADVKRRFSVDDDRIYLTGLSMGGGGTLALGLTRPDVWAAIAPVCPAALSGLDDLAANALNVPVKIFQGEIDPLVPADFTRSWHKRLGDAGVAAEYVEYPGVRHNSWDYAYRNAEIFNWFKQYKRNSYPARVRFATRTYRHSSAYWLQIDRLETGALTTVDARWQDATHLSVQTSRTTALSIKPQRQAVATINVTIDGQNLTTRSDRLSLLRVKDKWSASGKRSVPAPSRKRRDSEGPIVEAFASRHLYVYGTYDSPSDAERQRRREQAMEAADWSSSFNRGKLLVSLRAVSDKEVVPADIENSDLILFGTRETNGIIAKLAPKLPFSLNPGAADYGLLFIYPGEKGRYVAISSGLPWWTRLDQVKSPNFLFGAPRIRPLFSLGDYVLYRGGLDSVVAEGRFDSNWHLQKEEAATLAKTGAVEINSL